MSSWRYREREMTQVLTCLQAAMRYEEEDGADRCSRPQHSSSPQGQRLPVQRGPLEGPLPDASSLMRERRLWSYWEHSLSCRWTHNQSNPSLTLTRSAVAPGALEFGHGPLTQLSGGWSHSSRCDRRVHCPQMAAQGLSQPILQRGRGKK